MATAAERIRKIAQPYSAGGRRLQDGVNPRVHELPCENADLAGSCGFDGLNLCTDEPLNPTGAAANFPSLNALGTEGQVNMLLKPKTSAGKTYYKIIDFWIISTKGMKKDY